MSLAESLNWEQEEQYTSVFPRSVTSRKNQENLKLSEKKELLKKIADILAEEKFILSVLLYCDVAFSVYIFHNTSPAFAIKVPDGIHK